MSILRELGQRIRRDVHALVLQGGAHGRPLAPLLEPLTVARIPEEPVQPTPRARAMDTTLELRDPIGSKPTGMPVRGRKSSAYGLRYHPIKKAWLPHTGEDIAAPEGTAVRATAPGKVTFAGIRGGYGNLVEVDHGNGYATRYAHLQAISVEVRAQVARGAIIGTVGKTGLATGPHLHYEVLLKGEHQNPAPFLVS